MPNLLIIAQESKELAGLSSGLIRSGFVCSIIPHGNGFVEEIIAHRPNLVMMEMDGYSTNAEIQELMQSMKQENSLPLIALVAKEKLDDINGHLYIDDFLISPYDAKELVLRVKRLMKKANNREGSEIIRCGDLVIDQVKCEVTVSDRVIMLTFKEYELLKFLASNPSHVFTRETLLNKVWGYDYYGGDRTVDVHIRRLRSKIEDSSHTFIETVRNIGYRFKKDM